MRQHVFWQHHVLTQGPQTLADDGQGDDGTQNQWPDGPASRFDDGEHAGGFRLKVADIGGKRREKFA
jgi:hypothetical protein